MLQQTQTKRVISKYQEFIVTFPTMKDLADATPKKLLTFWSGLGYNRRVMYLQETIKQISKLKQFPQKFQELLKYPGIGPYTARSIPIFSFNCDYAAVDTNIKKVLLYHGFITTESKPLEIQSIADKLLPRGNSRNWHNALMDYASLVPEIKQVKPNKKTQTQKFTGSTRQIRGFIISKLLENSQLKINTFYEIVLNDIPNIKRTSLPFVEFQQIITKLEKDGLVVVNRDQISIVNK